MQVMIRYEVKRDQVERNLELLRAYFEELESNQPDGLRDAAFQLEDQVSFVHLVETDGPGRFSQLKAFQAYRATLDERCDEPPVITPSCTRSARTAFTDFEIPDSRSEFGAGADDCVSSQAIVSHRRD